MQVTREVDWVAAWYEIWGVYDATINFWITVTFAVIVAVHALGIRATRQVTFPLAALYTSFSLYTALRSIGLYSDTKKVVEELKKADIDFFQYNSTTLDWGALADVVLAAIFLFGTVFTIYFILTAHKRNSTD